VKLYFQRAELLLHEVKGEYVLEMAGRVLGTFKSEKRAVAEYNRLRRELEKTLPPAEISDAERTATLDRYLLDSVAPTTARRPQQRRMNRTRTFG